MQEMSGETNPIPDIISKTLLEVESIFDDLLITPGIGVPLDIFIGVEISL